MTDRPRATIPWFLVAATVLIMILFSYVFFQYVNTKRRVTGLETELRSVYEREHELQTRFAQQEQRYTLREKQMTAVMAERDALARKLEALEGQVSPPRGRR